MEILYILSPFTIGFASVFLIYSKKITEKKAKVVFCNEMLIKHEKECDENKRFIEQQSKEIIMQTGIIASKTTEISNFKASELKTNNLIDKYESKIRDIQEEIDNSFMTVANLKATNMS